MTRPPAGGGRESADPHTPVVRRRVRVLVVDDSVVVRRLVVKAVEADPQLEVVGTAANGQIALHKIANLSPDLITLDVEMPQMDGLQTLRRIRDRYPLLPVVMFSTLTERGAEVTLEALMLGANDYATKPTGVRGVDEGIAQVAENLVPKIRALCGLDQAGPRGRAARGPARHPGHPQPAPSASAVRLGGSAGPRVVVVAVSTGGPTALATILPALPSTFPVPVLVVQHMPPVFTRMLADRLDKQCAVRVREAAHGQLVQPGTVWIAPGDHHLLLRRREHGEITTATNQAPPENSCRPSADVLFRSAVDVYGAGVLGVVLTGMGHDGLAGAREIAVNGGSVLVQDEATSVVWGMPGGVAEAGLAGAVEPLERIGDTLVERVGAPRASVDAG